MSNLQEALAAEIRAEMAAQRIPATRMQALANINHGSFRNYFVTASRAVPFPTLVAVCDVLGVATSEMTRRAEERLAQQPPNPIRAELEAGLGRGAKRALGDIASGDDVADPSPARRRPGRTTRETGAAEAADEERGRAAG